MFDRLPVQFTVRPDADGENLAVALVGRFAVTVRRAAAGITSVPPAVFWIVPEPMLMSTSAVTL